MGGFHVGDFDKAFLPWNRIRRVDREVRLKCDLFPSAEELQSLDLDKR